MEEKNRKIVLISLVAILALAAGAYWLGFAGVKKTVPPASNSQPAGQVQNTDQLNSPAPAKDTIPELEGKIKSIQEKVIYIELADGKALVANITPSIPVITEGSDKAGGLSSLEVGAAVSVKMDEKNNATEITIKK